LARRGLGYMSPRNSTHDARYVRCADSVLPSQARHRATPPIEGIADGDNLGSGQLRRSAALTPDQFRVPMDVVSGTASHAALAGSIAQIICAGSEEDVRVLPIIPDTGRPITFVTGEHPLRRGAVLQFPGKSVSTYVASIEPKHAVPVGVLTLSPIPARGRIVG
jgi:hypothetical protein